MSPMEVPPPSLPDNEPEFVDEEWLSGSVESILSFYQAEDTLSGRVLPTAFVRCSRGGKTRALIEIAQRLKSSAQTAVFFVSFNDFSCIEEWEQADPLAALCRRVAFAARRERHARYKDFAKADVKPHQIIEWMGSNPRVLLIDELNLVTSLSSSSNSSNKLAKFLKINFLVEKHQYFAFSSHVISAVGKLSEYLDSGSDRSIDIRELPLIHNVLNAMKVFQWPDLDARKAIFYGLVPALIHVARLKESTNKPYLPFTKRDNAIEACIKNGLVTNKSILCLLANFLTGDKNILEPLHILMNTAEEQRLRWIPFHMIEVLKRFIDAPFLDENITVALFRINSLFDIFLSAKGKSGCAWEALFIAVLIIRIVTRKFDEVILPLDPSKEYSLSFNRYFATDKIPFLDVIKVDDLVSGITKPDKYPHVAIYYPSHASFTPFDCIVAVYDSENSRRLYAYELKEGDEIPDNNRCQQFEACVLVRGQPPEGKSTSKKQWTFLSKSQIADFFGESGKHWTPVEWKRLTSSEQ